MNNKTLPWDLIDTDEDKFKEECGVFAIQNHEDAAAMTTLGLHALQHRGQEACGIVTYNGEDFHAHRGLGLVHDTLSKESVISSLPGKWRLDTTATRPQAHLSCEMYNLYLPICPLVGCPLPITEI